MKRFLASRRQLLRAAAAALALPALDPVRCPAHGAGEQATQPSAAGGEVPWLAEVQRAPDPLPADAPRLAPLLVDQAGTKITTLDQWQRKREAIGRGWLDFLGLWDRNPHAPPKLEALSEDRVDGVVRQLVRYEVEPGAATEAYLLKPAAASGPRPGVAVFHSTIGYSIRQPAGLEGPPEKWFGLELARRGCVAFCPRNFLWAENQKMAIPQEVSRLRARHPQSKGMAKMLYDTLVAVDILAGVPGVDPKRLGAIGHSLGAKEVLYLAAFDERIRATVSSEGGIGVRFSNWHDAWYLGEEARQPDFSREHHELLALVAPRAFLLLGGDSADGARSWPFIEAALPVYRLYGGPARVGLLNHKKGHAVPPETLPQIYEWLTRYL